MASDSSSQINIAVGGGEGLLSFKEDFGLDITKHIKSIKERYEYMMLQMYVESFTDQVMLNCKYNLFHSAFSSWCRGGYRPNNKENGTVIVWSR